MADSPAASTSPANGAHLIGNSHEKVAAAAASSRDAPTATSASERTAPVTEEDRRPFRRRAEVATAPRAAPPQRQPEPLRGLLGRFTGLFGADASGRAASGAGAGTSGAPDFLAQSDDPDRRRLQAAAVPQATGTGALEAEWRRECLAFARVRKLAHVEEMRVLYLDREAEGPGGAAVVVVVGAHYRPSAATREEGLLHAVSVMEEVGARPYLVVLFNADAELPAVPDATFMQELHTALEPAHRSRLKALYLVHPSARLKLWVLALRLTEPAFYGKATAFLRLRTLAAHMPRPPVPPQHVLDYDRAHG